MTTVVSDPADPVFLELIIMCCCEMFCKLIMGVDFFGSETTMMLGTRALPVLLKRGKMELSWGWLKRGWEGLLSSAPPGKLGKECSNLENV
jgi:hypothetical protein